MFEGKKATFDAFISHSDEVVHMPSNVINLGGNDHSRVQAIAANINGCEHWAVQYHPVPRLETEPRQLPCGMT
jgi:GMP synthase-like glutamine amidotransferase